MADNLEPWFESWEARSAAILAAVRRAVREVVLRHAKLGQPVCTTRDGKVVWLQPEEVFALLAENDETGPSVQD
jgi:hypothetical protein